MKIFVTGGTGCLGGNVIDYILNETDHEVVAGVRSTSDISRLEKLPIKIEVLDFENIKSITQILSDNIDAIIHCAGNTSYQTFDRDQQYKDNVVVTENLVRAAEKIGGIRFVYTSTIATLPKTIRNNYGMTKLQAERIVLASDLSSVVLRPAILIGKYDTVNYFKMFDLIKRDKYQVALPRKVDFCDAYEVAKAHVVATENSLTLREYTLGGYVSDWLDVGQKIAKVLNSKGPKYLAPKSLLYVIAAYGELKNRMLKKGADLNFDLFDLVYGNNVVTEGQKIASKRDLSYNDKVNIDELINQYVNWLEENNYL